MALYSIADFIIDIQNKYEYIDEQCADYAYNGSLPADFEVSVSEDYIIKERLQGDEIYPDGYLESVCVYREIAFKLPIYDSLLLHASVISYKDRGIAFLAPSGTGKTTHTFLWQKLLGDDVRIINGDKPIIRFFDNVPYAYGTPWAGKENWQINDKVKLTDVCIIERSDTCSVFKADTKKYLPSLMMQVLRPTDPLLAIKTLGLVDRLVSSSNLWVIQCDISRQAVELAYNTICEGEKVDEVKI